MTQGTRAELPQSTTVLLAASTTEERDVIALCAETPKGHELYFLNGGIRFLREQAVPALNRT